MILFNLLVSCPHAVKEYKKICKIDFNPIEVHKFFLTNALFNIFFASSNFCRLLITFANSLDPDQDRKNVGPDLNPNSFTL